jgi:hypothetical protein
MGDNINKHMKQVGGCGLVSFSQDIFQWWVLMNALRNVRFEVLAGRGLEPRKKTVTWLPLEQQEMK